MKKILDVPHWTQYFDIKEDFWQGRSCGIVSLAMIFDYYDVKFDLSELIELGVKIDNYDPKIGWKHQTIVELAKKYGLQSYRTEDESLDSLVNAVDQDQPIIVSVYKEWDPRNGGHLVVLNGYFESEGVLEGFYVCDPLGASYKNKNQFIPLDKFVAGWKKRAIYASRKPYKK